MMCGEVSGQCGGDGGCVGGGGVGGGGVVGGGQEKIQQKQ